MADVKDTDQMEFDEVVLNDPELLRLVEDLKRGAEQRKQLNRDIRALDVKGRTEKVLGKIEYDESVGGRFRVGHGLVVEIKPPGEAKDVEFTLHPKVRLKIVEEEG